MLLTNFLPLVSALALAALPTLAQNIQFQSVPGPFTIGKAANITWAGGSSSSSSNSVTITLRKGTPSTTIDTIGIIGSNLRGNNFTWTPAATLVPGNDYALQITQGLDDVNYSGLFSVLAADSGSQTTILAVGGGSTSVVATLTANVSSTVTVAAGSSAGTGTVMSRNTTMVSPTLSSSMSLTRTSTVTSTTGTATGTGSTGGAAKATGLMGYGALAVGAVFLL